MGGGMAGLGPNLYAEVPDYGDVYEEYSQPAISAQGDYSHSGGASTSPTRIEVDPYDVLAAALVPGALQRNDFRPEKKRWYVLLVFVWLSGMQGLIWCTFSTVPESSNNYFGEPSHSQKFVDLILNWGQGRPNAHLACKREREQRRMD